MKSQYLEQHSLFTSAGAVCHTIRVIISVGGEGTRVRTLTLKAPNTMLPISRKPLLGYILSLRCLWGITDVAINLHHLPHAVMNQHGEGSGFGIPITYSVESPMLDTVWALTDVRAFLDQTSQSLMVCVD